MSGNAHKRPYISSPVPDISMGSTNGPPSAHQFSNIKNERSSALLDLIAPRLSPDQDQAQHLEHTEELFWAGAEALQTVHPTITEEQLTAAFALLLAHIQHQRQHIFLRVKCGPAYLRKVDTKGAVCRPCGRSWAAASSSLCWSAGNALPRAPCIAPRCCRQPQG